MIRPHVDDEMLALIEETSAMIARGELQPDPIEPWWEGRRENEQTPDYLGRVLDEAGLPELARNARAAHYDDYFAPAEVADGLETIRLVRDLRRAARAEPAKAERVAVIENAVRRGDFDATKAESDRWMASNDGQETFRELLPKAHDTFDDVQRKVGRNDLCPCGSGLKFKRCHGQ